MYEEMSPIKGVGVFLRSFLQLLFEVFRMWLHWLMYVKAKESWEMDPPEKLEQSELSKNKGTDYFKVRL